MNYNLIILEVTFDTGFGEGKTVIHRFTSEKKVEKYLDNRFIISYKRIAEYKDLSYEEFNEKWRNKG